MMTPKIKPKNKPTYKKLPSLRLKKVQGLFFKKTNCSCSILTGRKFQSRFLYSPRLLSIPSNLDTKMELKKLTKAMSKSTLFFKSLLDCIQKTNKKAIKKM